MTHTQQPPCSVLPCVNRSVAASPPCNLPHKCSCWRLGPPVLVVTIRHLTPAAWLLANQHRTHNVQPPPRKETKPHR